ncbi:MAG: GcrA cell cycle regulator [Hyphomicrobiales bacterium]|nr:GcrA cell cycle regulator [Hyphomicrobiales bacterium]MDE2115425.1 GcrA cell cycle regulator [Hyphomicrobiales bacterium]
MSWTDERIETLRQLWLEGLSASKIASRLGSNITRNAVIGKVHRMGMANREKTTDQLPTRARNPDAPRNTMPVTGHGGGGGGGGVRGNTALATDMVTAIASLPQVQTKTAEAVVIPMTERVTIMELRESMCRWPIGDPMSSDFRYCGSRSPIGSGPYCAGHAQIAYQPAHDRRRDRRQVRAS